MRCYPRSRRLPSGRHHADHPMVSIVVMAIMVIIKLRVTTMVVVMMTAAMAAYERKVSLDARRAGRRSRPKGWP